MKKFLLLLTLFSSLFTSNAHSQINLILTSPPSVGACQLNSYLGKYQGTGVVQDLSISSFIINSGALTCGISNGSLVIVDSIENQNGATITPTQTFLDALNGSWSATLDTIPTSDSVFIYYHILIDCSVIPTGSSIPSLQLVQLWTDSSLVLFNINNSGNADTSNTIKYPLLVNLPPPTYTMGYKDTIELAFVFANSGTADANINVSFTPDVSQYCGAMDTTISYFYKVGILGTPTIFIPANSFFVNIPKDTSLFIFQRVVSDSCLGDCSPHAEFKWHCALNSGYESSFCDSCYGSKELIYSIQNANSPVLHIDRLLPVSDYVANYDTSCVNQDTSLLREWKYKIYVTGDGLLDYAYIHFHNSDPIGFNRLSLIPFSSIEIDTFFNSGGCYMDTAYFINPYALSASDIPDPLGFLKLIPHNFGKNDSIILSFKTYRCVEENDILFNVEKNFNTWKFEDTFSHSICSESKSPVYDTLYAKLNITDHTGSNISQLLFFAPTITDLSAFNEKATPVDSLWGDSAHFEIELNGYLYQAINRQLFGCYKDSINCIPEGYLRISIETGTGLAPSMLDSMVQLRYLDSLGSEVLISPEYYYTSIPVDSCKEGITNLYYKLSSPGVVTALNTGFFDFTLKSCCGGQNGGVPYAVKFYFLLDPSGDCVNLTYPNSGHDTIPFCDGGDGCAWLPLSKVEDDIVVHCPGCLTPGIVVSNYSIYRSSFGLQDSNNDGKADDSLTQIEKGTTWFNQNKSKLKTAYAGLGDKLEDRMLAYFSPGELPSGYNYTMMVNQNAKLKYLQLSRLIPHGNSIMNITVDTIVIYIDTPDTTQTEPCIECVEYGLSPAQYSTQRKLVISGASINNYLDTVGDYYLFTLSSRDSTASWIGNLHNASLTTDSSINHPLNGFFENQRYRMRVNYSICGNFMMANNDIFTDLDDVRKESEIKNSMWLSGSPKPADAFDTEDPQPASNTLLHLAGWSFPPDTIGSEVDSAFAEQYIFICEDFGGKLYFFSHDTRNNSYVGDLKRDCIKSINISSESSVARNFLKVYPYEYRPATFQASEYRVIVPPNYYITSSYVKNTIILNNSITTSDIVYFPVSDTTGSVSIYDSLFQYMSCLADSSVADTNLLYFGSSYTSRDIYLELKPINCSDSLLIRETDSIVKIIFTGNRNTCININSCAQILSDTVWTRPYEDVVFTINPNDSITRNQNVTGSENTICFPFTLTNPSITGSTYAPNYFLYMPSLNDLSFLSGWTLLNITTGIPVPMVDSVFQIDDVLGIDEPARNFALCANFIACPDTSFNQLTLQFGWHCDGFPSKSDSDTVCGTTSIVFNIQTYDTRVNELGKVLPVFENIPYSLCSPFTYKKCFRSVDLGDVSPIAFFVDTPATWLNIVSFYVSRDSCPNDSLPVLLQSTSPGSYQFIIPDSALTMLGYEDSLLHYEDCLCGAITFQSECDTAGGDLPNIRLSGESYCGDTLSIDVLTFFTAVWDSTSACSDCFEITKSLSSYNDTIRTGDTLTYNITIWSNNADSVPAVLTDSLPAGFVVTSSLPHYITLPDTGFTTFQLQGYFTITGSCPDLQNEVFLHYTDYDLNNNPTSNLITDQDTACLEVISACITDASILFKANEYSSNGYSSSYVNEHIYLEGDFYVDMDMSFENCIIKAKAGSRIILVDNFIMTFYNTTISACDTMWQGILVDATGTVNLENLNSIQDAHEGVNLGLKGKLVMIKSEIINSVTGVRVPPLNPSSFGGSIDIREAVFGMYRTVLLPAYVGQPSHDTIIPYAGIDINDASLAIGDDFTDANIFHNMNIGIRGFRSDLDIYNCIFDSIRYIPYHNTKGNASAVVSIGDTALNITSYVRVNPLTTSADNMVHCNNGVYTFYSELRIYGCTLDSMKNGIEVNHCKDGLLTAINGNTINARNCGINLFDNYGGSGQNIEGNRITIDGEKTGLGITAKELTTGSTFTYNITSNTVDLVNGKSGIELNGLRVAKVDYNLVQLVEGDSTATTTSGVILNGGKDNTVSCNQVYGFGDDDTLRNGYKVSLSPRNSILCNHSDSIGYGFLFEGATCTDTKFKGNYMGKSYSGLYLNSSANIGQQPVQNLSLAYHGNVWVDSARYRSGYGAVNKNSFPNTNLQFSLFTINQCVAGHYPIVPLSTGSAPFFVSDQNWFSLQNSGGHFDCAHTGTCATASEGGGDEEFRMMVIEDSSVTSEFIEESKIMAQQEVYNELLLDSVLRNSNLSYGDFVIDKSTSSIGELHQVESKIIESNLIDSTLRIAIINARSELQPKIDSLFSLNQLIISDTSSYLVFLKENLLDEMANDKIAISGLVQQLKTQSNAVVSPVSSLNNNISTLGIPDANEKFINEIYLRYRKEGVDIIIQEYENILQVAVQCPSSGGQSVHRARIFIAIVNDSIEYNDGNVCATMGIFRMANPNGKNNLEPKLICFPNPASSSLQLIFDGLSGTEFNLEIHDSSGRLISSKKFISSGVYYLNTSSLSDGLFHILVRDNAGKNVSSKFIVSR